MFSGKVAVITACSPPSWSGAETVIFGLDKYELPTLVIFTSTIEPFSTTASAFKGKPFLRGWALGPSISIVGAVEYPEPGFSIIKSNILSYGLKAKT